MKFDKGKPKIHLVPPAAIRAIAEVFTFGAEKYGEHNWRQDRDKFPYSRHISSIQRHLLDFQDGIDNDDESGLSHLAHAMTQLMILYTITQEAPQMDDRFKFDGNSKSSKKKA